MTVITHRTAFTYLRYLYLKIKYKAHSVDFFKTKDTKYLFYANFHSMKEQKQVEWLILIKVIWKLIIHVSHLHALFFLCQEKRKFLKTAFWFLMNFCGKGLIIILIMRDIIIFGSIFAFHSFKRISVSIVRIFIVAVTGKLIHRIPWNLI